jgi:peptide/nickel transport system substrate-binding protein
MSFTRNPNYWNKTTIKGKEYQLPFVDELVFPIIPDDATKMSAIRTGKIDLHMAPRVAQWENYDSVGSNLVKSTFTTGGGQVVGFNTKLSPYDNKTVRQALSIGTDRSAIAKLLMSESLPIRFHPQSEANPTTFIPDNQLTEEIRALYKPKRCRQTPVILTVLRLRCLLEV